MSEAVTEFKVLGTHRNPLTGKERVTALINGRVFVIDRENRDTVKHAFEQGRLGVEGEQLVMEEPKK